MLAIVGFLSIASLLLAAAGAAFCVGIVLTYFGIRGRKIDDHPLCRHCGFDLTGKPQTSLQCGECGANLAAKNAVRLGHRQRRGGLLLGGTVLALVGVLGGLPIAYVALSKSNLDRYKPLWWLKSDALRSNVVTRYEALGEIHDRYLHGKLSASQVDGLVSEALRVQANSAAPWNEEWGNLIEAEEAAGRLPAERWRQYVHGVKPTFSLRVRPQVAIGDVLPIQYAQTDRAASPSILTLRTGFSLQGASIDGAPVSPSTMPTSEDEMVALYLYQGMGSYIDLSRVGKALSPGKHTLRMKQPLTLVDGKGLSEPLVSDLAADFGVTAAEKPTVAFKHDERAAAEVEKHLRIWKFELMKGDKPIINFGIDLNGGSISADVGFEISARIANKDWLLTSVASSDHHFGINTWVPVPGFPADATQVDLILKPSLKAAADTLSTTEILDTPITLHNVPVTRAAE